MNLGFRSPIRRLPRSAGRKRHGARSEQIIVRVEPRIKKEFEKQCEALGLNPSKALRSLMTAFTRLQLRNPILTGKQLLTRDLTAGGYIAMSESEQVALWEKWYRKAEDYSKDAVVAVKKIAGSNR